VVGLGSRDGRIILMFESELNNLQPPPAPSLSKEGKLVIYKVIIILFV
jgi:hypothetical protein